MAKRPHPHVAPSSIVSGVPWRDSAGAIIEAHGGGLLEHAGLYYWYGEDHHLGLGNKTGIHCYASADLLHWEDRGVVLPKEALPPQYHDTGACERPKVLYNAASGRFVMWMHLDGGDGYTYAEAGIATAERADGAFTLLRRGRPIMHDFGGKEDKYQQVSRGPTYRDMALFLDDDGKAYVFYAAEGNPTMYVSRLNRDFTWVEEPSVLGQTWNRIMIGMDREAPAPFKHRGRYHLLSSACTGWGPNPALHVRSEHPLGPYQIINDPSRGIGWETTFRSQPTYVVRAPGKPPGSFIYLADRWVGHALEQSSYVWLPFYVRDDHTLALDWYDSWQMDIFDRAAAALPAPVVRADARRQRLSWSRVAGAALYRVYGNGEHLGSTSGTSFTLPLQLAGRARAYTVVATALRGAWSAPSPVCIMPSAKAHEMYLSAVAPDHVVQGWSSLRLDQSCTQVPLQLGSIQYAHGLGTHAVSRITYRLGGAYGRLTTLAGLNPTVSQGRGEVIFRIYGDGVLLAETPPTLDSDGARELAADLSGVQVLELVVDAHSRSHHYGHADWCDTRLHPLQARAARRVAPPARPPAQAAGRAAATGGTRARGQRKSRR
jgi:hypothetical protein